MTEPIQQHFHSNVQFSFNAGRYQVLTMTAGQGNGWLIPAETLQASLPLWEQLHSFVDHALFGHSVRDLCGVLTDPQWDEASQGIRMVFNPFGPSAEIAESVAREVIANPAFAQGVGFSADLLFSAHGKTVESILKVNSADLVIDPARGGKFLRSLNSRKEDAMPEPDTIHNSTFSSGAVEPEIETGAAPVTGDQKEIHTGGQATPLGLYQALLESHLTHCGLPEAWRKRIRADFAGRTFQPAELQSRLEADRLLLSASTAGRLVQGPGGIRDVFSEGDFLEAALDDLLGARRRPELQKVQAHPLTGIRELYMLMTGDHSLHGGFHPERARFANSSDFTGLVKNALNKLIAEHWEALGSAGYNWWQSIVQVEHFESLNDITATLVGTVGTLPTVAEGAEYTELAVGDSPETAAFVKKGGYIPLTLELIDRDQTQRLKSYPRELANSALRTLSAAIASLFTQNAGAGPAMADGGNLFNATAVGTAGGHANLLTSALSAAQWDVVAQAVFNQPMLIKNAGGYYGTGPKMAVEPRFCLVPRSLAKTARDAFLNAWDVTSNVHAENLLKGAVVPITVPEWTDANDWAAVCDPRVAPAIIVGERFGLLPEIYIANQDTSPAVFMNDEHRLKVRHFSAILVADFRPLHKSNVA